MICSRGQQNYLLGHECAVNLRIPRAFRATDVLASLASLVSRSEEALAAAASPAHALARLLVNQILSSSLGGTSEDEVLLGLRVPVGDDGGVLGTVLDYLCALLPALLPLGLGLLGRDTRALLAPRMLALGAFLGSSERGVALVALAVDTHLDGLLNTESMALSRVPLARLQLQAIELTELLGTLLEQLSARDLLGIGVNSLGRSSSRGGLGGAIVIC